MGINIHEDKRVEYDDSHQERVDTSLERNISSKHQGDITYHFIFRRVQSKSGDSGDGNPLIYALKEMRGYRIDPDCRDALNLRAKEIVLNHKDLLKADLIIPIPSSYRFCMDFSASLSDWLEIPIFEAEFIGKKTVSQVLAEAATAKPIFPKAYVRNLYKAQIKEWERLPPNTQVTMKLVDKKIRPYFNHLQITQPQPELVGKTVLVVDDLMASGTSMHRTIELLRGQGIPVAAGVCFLSGL